MSSCKGSVPWHVYWLQMASRLVKILSPKHCCSSECLVFIPREGKCLVFKDDSGISVGEWIEEVQTGMRAHHLCMEYQAFLFLGHLEREAKQEIKFRAEVDH